MPDRFVNTLDMPIAQEVPGLFEGNKGAVPHRLQNFLNLINNKWGRNDELGGFPNNGVVAAGVESRQPASSLIRQPAGTVRTANGIFLPRNTSNAFP